MTNLMTDELAKSVSGLNVKNPSLRLWAFLQVGSGFLPILKPVLKVYPKEECMKRFKVELLLAAMLVALLAGCNYLIDTSKPSVSISPDTGSVQSSTTVKVTASDSQSGIKSIELFNGNGESLATKTVPEDEVSRGSETLEYSLDSMGATSGASLKLRAKATNGFGRTSEMKEVTLTVAGPVSSNPNTAVPGASPVVSIDPTFIEPSALTPKPSGCKDNTDTGCFAGTINVLVRAAAPVGNDLKEVILTIDSEVSGTSTKRLTDFPARFDIDTTIYPNNDVLTLSAKATTEDNGVGTSNDVSLTVFNPAPPPVLAITAPSGESDVAGLLNVGVSVSQLSDSGYTLDLNQNGSVDGEEGFHVELIDFTGSVVEEFYINDESASVDVDSTESGSYIVRDAVDTIQYANDTYTLSVSLPALYTEDDIAVRLVRSIIIDTNNRSRVAPSVLILSPTDEDLGAVKTIKDPTNAYISVQVTDNGGLDFIEVRMYEGDPEQDATPSRFVYYSDDRVAEKVSLPLNYNANPYLGNAEYTARVISQDGEGNRSFQDLKVNLDRTRGQDASYFMAQTGPREPIRDEDGNITGYGDIMSTVPVNTGVSFEVSGAPAGATFDHLVRTPSDEGFFFRPLIVGTESSAYGTGLDEEGSYTFVTQITTEEGDVYLTNSIVISAKSDEE